MSENGGTYENKIPGEGCSPCFSDSEFEYSTVGEIGIRIKRAVLSWHGFRRGICLFYNNCRGYGIETSDSWEYSCDSILYNICNIFFLY